MDPNELRALVEALPLPVREELAKGPMPWLECRVCDALDGLECEPAVRLIDYHDFCAMEGSGPRCYARCVEIYEAAGWNARDLHGFEGDDG